MLFSVFHVFSKHHKNTKHHGRWGGALPRIFPENVSDHHDGLLHHIVHLHRRWDPPKRQGRLQRPTHHLAFNFQHLSTFYSNILFLRHLQQINIFMMHSNFSFQNHVSSLPKDPKLAVLILSLHRRPSF